MLIEHNWKQYSQIEKAYILCYLCDHGCITALLSVSVYLYAIYVLEKREKYYQQVFQIYKKYSQRSLGVVSIFSLKLLAKLTQSADVPNFDVKFLII